MTNKKLDQLLQQANAYEKMALFGNRKNFLTAIAQTTGTPLSATQKQQLDSVMKNLSANSPTATALVNRLMDHMNSPAVDAGRLSQDLREAVNTLPGNRPEARQQAQALAQQVASMGAAPENDSTMRMPTDKITGYAPIDKDVQQLVSQFVTEHGAGIPISKIDGRLGPETRQAINNAKKYFNQPGMSDAQLFEQLKMPQQQIDRAKSIQNAPIAPGIQNTLNRTTKLKSIFERYGK